MPRQLTNGRRLHLVLVEMLVSRSSDGQDERALDFLDGFDLMTLLMVHLTMGRWRVVPVITLAVSAGGCVKRR